MSQITPDERLKVNAYTDLYGGTPEDPCYDISNDSGHPSDDYSITEPLEKETARRLVACWNACRGIKTEQLEIVAATENDEARLSWLGWSAERVTREACR